MIMASKDRRLRRKVRRSYIISTVSIALVLFMLGVVSYVTLSALSVAVGLKDNVVVSVEVADALLQEERVAIKDAIEGLGYHSEIVEVSGEEKLGDEAFRRQFEVDFDLLLGDNPLRDSYEVRFKSEYATADNISTFVERVSSVSGVEYIAAPPVDVVQRMEERVKVVSLALLLFLAVLTVISVLLLNNTIRLAIYSKRYLINTMKLVGATKWYIMRPLLASALKQGVVAGLVAASLVVALVYGVMRLIPSEVTMLGYEEVGVIVGGLVVVGVVITLVVSAIAVNKFVNMKSNKIYLY